MSSDMESGAPWYRCFWPWFIVALLATAVLASIATAVIAITGADSLVHGDYYRDGMAINQRLDREAMARSLGIGAELRSQATGGELQLRLHGQDTQEIEAVDLSLSHPTRAELDLQLRMRRGADRLFRASLEAPLRGSWYVALLPAGVDAEAPDNSNGSPGVWRISQRIVLTSNEPAQLGRLP